MDSNDGSYGGRHGGELRICTAAPARTTKAFRTDGFGFATTAWIWTSFNLGKRPRDSLTIGVVCALRPEKDLGTLIEAFARDQALGIAAADRRQWFHAGANCVRRPRRGGWPAIARFVPATGQVAEWLRAIDIFVLPSQSEALSNSLLEAMACGCCPVASRVGGNAELIRHGENGMLFEAGDVDQLSECSRHAGGTPGAARATGRAGRARTAEQFSIGASARAHGGDLYRIDRGVRKGDDTARSIAVRFRDHEYLRAAGRAFAARRDARPGSSSSRSAQAAMAR